MSKLVIGQRFHRKETGMIYIFMGYVEDTIFDCILWCVNRNMFCYAFTEEIKEMVPEPRSNLSQMMLVLNNTQGMLQTGTLSATPIRKRSHQSSG